MKAFSLAARCGALAALICHASAQSIAELNSNKYLSPLQNRNVVNVTGLVTAKGPDGFWIRSTIPDGDPRTSESVYVFGSAAGRNLTTGDLISLSGRVLEYRNNNGYNYLAGLSNPSVIRLISQNNSVVPVVLGGSLSPPTEEFTSLDNGNVFGIPNNASQISRVNPTLEPLRYGLDFWESLMGELVTIKSPKAVARPNTFGDTWVVGDWALTGQNAHGGLTMTAKDSNPETILIGSPLDGSRNPNSTKLADNLEDITGIVFQAFGFYRILPLTSIKIASSQDYPIPKTQLQSSSSCSGLTVGDYNVENLAPDSAHLGQIARHIVQNLNTPDIMFLQEIQDDNGPTNDAVVSANLTLATLSKAIRYLNSAVNYAYFSIDPVDDKDGGQPGGNIRPAYLYNPSVVRLVAGGVPGNSTQANMVLPGPSLKYNPGLIDPTNTAFTSSRKPVVAQWETVKEGSKFFTVNVHLTSKGGSSSIHGDPRPPINGGVANRAAQANITGNFIAQILAHDQNAAIITAGDFNEFAFVRPLTEFKAISGLEDLDVAAGIPELERYTYLFDMNCQELDHMYVSPKIASAQPLYEHVHINTWAASDDVVSDHDPSVAKLNVC